ncbi:unnamed protein product [Brassicogethes aeneus]|uniref:Uncharacterized protein n=1 Tax=Brassicogethes aeneus TaxID=1431903 RepID=A0A9P0B8S8_BRAAE|nr:unnamed protein product [Brassicogethes aeneus]
MPSRSTTNLLKQLRSFMQNASYVNETIQAYIVPSSDPHGSEYLAGCDEHRAYISGFTGSAGTAVVTEKQALLWTDGRYFLQASQQLDENWTLMKEGLPQTPSQGTWLTKNLPMGSRVGVDPKVYSHDKFVSLQKVLEGAGQKLIPIEGNLVEAVWVDRPNRPTNPVHPLGLHYTGMPLKNKFRDIQSAMKEKHAKYLVLTKLDEIAWFLNLRGGDIKYNPVFFSYVVLAENSYVIFINPKQYNEEIGQHLKAESGDIKFQVESYESIGCYLKEISKNVDGGFVWFSDAAGYDLTSTIPKKSLLTEMTPVQLMKAIKNSVEIEGMKRAHIKDAVALCCYFSWLEKEVASGAKITEISGANKLEQLRSEQEDYVGLSFDTISSVGPHGAIIHYSPSESTDVPITNQTVYLCDSGGQYKDGTTDVTRTMHFGTPSDLEKKTYTLVLKGQLQLGRAVFPSKIKGNCLDSLARQFLWEVGLDYGHGTGHGIGSYLNVHEGPMGISWKPIPDDPGLDAGMFVSNEPGYYEDGLFGARIEDIVQIVPANTTYNFNQRGFLTFHTITLVPKQTKMIDVAMLTDREIKQLNDYHVECRQKIGPLLEKPGYMEAKQWLWKETEPISR